MKKLMRATFALFAALIVGSCTSAKNRGDGSNVFGDGNRKRTEASDWMFEHYRSGSIYDEFSPVLLAEALLRNEKYLNFLERGRAAQQNLNEENFKKNLDETLDREGYFISYALYFNSANNFKPKLGGSSPDWVFHHSVHGSPPQPPLSVVQLKKSDFEYRYLNRFFKRIEPWTRVYLIKFPRPPENGFPNPAANPTEFDPADALPPAAKITVKGVGGSLGLIWDDTDF